AAAEAVVGPVERVEDILELLIRRSLLEWDKATQRYSMHELVRAFAEARQDDPKPVRLRHAQYYLQVAEQAERMYRQRGEAMLAALALFDRERTQIDAAWAWARKEAGDPDVDVLLLAYVEATSSTGALRYHKRLERIPQLEAAVAAAQRLGRRSDEGSLLGELGSEYLILGDVPRAISYHDQHLAIARDIGDQRAEGRA